VIIPDGYAQLNIQFEGSDLPFGAETTLGFDLREYAGGVGTLLAGIVTSFNNQDFPTWYDNDIAITNLHMKLGPNDTGPAYDLPCNIGGDGGASGSTPQVSYLIRKRTADGGHAGSGRMYWPGVIASAVDNDGTVHSGTVTSIQDSFNQFHQDMTDVNATLVLLHGADSPIEDPSEIVIFTCDTKVATQRRRLRR